VTGLSLQAWGGSPWWVCRRKPRRLPNYDPTRPLILFRHESERCTVVGGRFEITDFKIDQSGYVERFRATFEQRCAGSSATLWAQVDG
jgi:hypothetical protein